jgi:DNA-directed RNA polymerase specialized sigma24 family protein
MDYDKLYEHITNIVYSNRYQIRKEVSQLVSSTVSEDDLIQELAIKYYEEQPTKKLWNFCYNTLRKWRRRAGKLSPTLSTDQMYEDYNYEILDTDDALNIVCGEAEAPIFNFPDYDLIETFGILDNIDMAVLRGHMTRYDAADTLGIPYDTYRKKLYRNIEKVREILSLNV